MKQPKTVKVTIEDMSEAALTCRSIAHKFNDGSDENIVLKRGRFAGCERHIRCERCGYTKVQVLDSDLEVVDTIHPKYPDRYLHAGPRIRKSVARREDLKRRGFKVKS